MSQAIVNILKVIQIKIKKRTFFTLFFCLFHISGDITLAAHSVAKPCQIVRVRLSLKLPLVHLFLSYVVDRAHKHFPAVCPRHILIKKVIPVALFFHADFYAAGNRILRNLSLKYIRQSILLRLLAKLIFKTLIGKQDFTVSPVPHINSASYIVQDIFQQSIRALLGLLLNALT